MPPADAPTTFVPNAPLGLELTFQQCSFIVEFLNILNNGEDGVGVRRLSRGSFLL